MQIFRKHKWLLTALIMSFTLIFAYSSGEQLEAAKNENVSDAEQSIEQDLMAAVMSAGKLRVIVQLNLEVEPEGSFRSTNERQAQREMIRSAQNRLVSETASEEGISFLTDFNTLPMVVMEVDAAGLSTLQARDDVSLVVEDELSAPSLNSARPIVGSDVYNNAGFDGTGSVVAVLDTGVDVTHTAFTTGRNRIVAEGCFSTESDTYGGVHSVCPNGATESTAIGSADDCIDEVAALNLNGAKTDCKHGTHVAGIIGANDGNNLIGIAPDVDLVPVQVFSAFDSYGRMLSFTSNQIQGLEYILSLTEQYNIVAVNMSLGGNYNVSSCDYDARRQAILNLKSVGVATIIASGNEGHKDGIGSPACISEAIAVGSTNDNDTVSSFSNISPQIDLMAPGNSITSAFPGNQTGNMSGTSMATPMVAGAWALVSESHPELTIDEKLNLLQNTGEKIDDTRTAGQMVGMSRVDMAKTLENMAGALDLSLNAESVFFAQKSETFSVNVTNSSEMIANGMTISTTLPTELTAIESTITHSGSISDQTIIWKNLSLAAGESLTVTFEAIGRIADEVRLEAFVADTEGRSDKASQNLQIKPLAACTSYEGFESYWTPENSAWQPSVESDGQVNLTSEFFQVGTGAIALEDFSINGVLNRSAIEIAVDTRNSSSQTLEFYWQGHGYYASYEESGLFASTDRGENWFKIATPDNNEVWEKVSVDLAQAAANAGYAISDSIFLKIQFMGDGPLAPAESALSTGLVIDDIQLNCGTNLIWDGGGDGISWSDPLNWEPNIVPNGNTVTFGSMGSATSNIDSEFINPINDLILSKDWTGIVTQSAPLNVQGDFVQEAGLFVMHASYPLTVDGAVILTDGALRQTQTLTDGKMSFLQITNGSATEIQYSGYELSPNETPSGLNEVTVTIAGPNAGSVYCNGLSSQTMNEVNRCFDISTTSTVSLTNRIWLETDEILSESTDPTLIVEEFNRRQAAAADGTTQILSSDMVKIYGYVDGSWTEFPVAQMGTENDLIYAELNLDQPVPLLAQQMSRTPTAITLSSISAITGLNLQHSWIFPIAIWFILISLTGMLLFRNQAPFQNEA